MTITRGELALRTLNAQYRVATELYLSAVNRALDASCAGQLIQPEALDELVRHEQRVSLLLALIGIVESWRPASGAAPGTAER